MTIICGIDPGLNGALCFLSEQCITHDMPTLSLTRGGKNKREVDAHALGNMLWKSHAGHAFIEQAWSRPTDSAPNAFATGRGYGIIIGVLATVGIPFTFVPPAKWKKVLGVPAAKDGARARASQLLPHGADQWRLVKHDGRAEAACIALYGIRSLNAIGEAA